MKVTCICGNDLAIMDISSTIHSDDLAEIKVAPCEVCIREAEISGYDQGYDQGKSESED